MTPSTYQKCLLALTMMHKDECDALRYAKAIDPTNAALGAMIREVESTESAILELNEQELSQ